MAIGQPDEHQESPHGDTEPDRFDRVPPAHASDDPQQELQRLRAALAESRRNEEFLAGLIESALDAVISVDASHRIVQFNPAAERMFGLPAAEALGQPIELLLPKDARPRHAEQMHRFARTGVSSRQLAGPGCVRGRRANGEVFQVDASISQTEVAGSRLFTVILRDISRRVLDEQALRESEERLALFAATTFEGIVISEQGRVVDCNEQFARMAGYASQELAGRPIEELVVPEDRARVLENIRRGRESIVEHVMLRKNGERIVVEAHGKTIPAGSPDGRRMTAVRDITERKRIEQALRDSQADLNRAQSVAQIGSWRLNIRRNELQWSDESYRIHGIPRGTPLNYEVFLAAVHPDDRAYVDRMWRAALRGAPYDIEHRLVVNGAVKWVRERAELEFDEQGTVLGGFGTVQDITSLKAAEQALIEADHRKDEFLAMLAHELRNPLTPIRNAAHVLGRLGTREPRVAWAQQIIGEQVNHLTRLVDDLLDVSRIVRGKATLSMEPVELADVLSQALEMARPQIDAMRHQVEVKLPGQPLHVRGDPVRLAQVLLNLLDNAAKYTPESGSIGVEARVAGPVVEIRVRDSGIGIPADLLPRVFDLFQQGERTLDRSQGGLGIGLTLVKRLVELHGGVLEADSAGPGLGSTFTICLPLLPARPAAAGRAAAEAGVLPAACCRVLVVDDDEAVADSMSVLLELEGHAVRTAASGEAALALAREFRPHLVLLDIGLRGMDGYEVARQLRALQGEDEKLRLVAVTGYGHEDARARSRDAGFDQHLVKPVHPEALVELLAEISRTADGDACGT